jgi:hypothetical protein
VLFRDKNLVAKQRFKILKGHCRKKLKTLDTTHGLCLGIETAEAFQSGRLTASAAFYLDSANSFPRATTKSTRRALVLITEFLFESGFWLDVFVWQSSFRTPQARPWEILRSVVNSGHQTFYAARRFS